MNTLNRIREIGFGVALTAGLLIAALHPRDDRLRLPAERDGLEVCAASKGALCDVGDAVTDLGRLVVTARRDDALVAQLRERAPATDLGQLTVTAPRIATHTARVAASYDAPLRF